MIGVAILIVCAPALAEVAINFSSFEYFWLALLGPDLRGVHDQRTAAQGHRLAAVRPRDQLHRHRPAAGYPRFTFGSVELLQGISFIPAMIGMFALSELLRGVVTVDRRAR